MTIPKSSTGIYHIVLGSVSEIGIFNERSDYKKFMETMKLYKTSLKVKILGYSLSPLVVHLVLHDKNDNLSEFISRVEETYSVYYQRKRFVNRVFHHSIKIKAIESYEAFVNIYKYIHKVGENSFKRFQIYDNHKKDEYLDGDYVLSALGSNKDKAKKEMAEISVQEYSEPYTIYMKEMEYFCEEKKSIRIKRAEEFLDQFLEKNSLAYSDLDKEEHYSKKLDLIKEYRDYTDLSYRDIGSILDLSHTSIIRLWRKAHERDIINGIS